jgi:hypothetical protein
VRLIALWLEPKYSLGWHLNETYNVLRKAERVTILEGPRSPVHDARQQPRRD